MWLFVYVVMSFIADKGKRGAKTIFGLFNSIKQIRVRKCEPVY